MLLSLPYCATQRSFLHEFRRFSEKGHKKGRMLDPACLRSIKSERSQTLYPRPDQEPAIRMQENVRQDVWTQSYRIHFT